MCFLVNVCLRPLSRKITLSDVGDVDDMAKNAIHILSDADRLKEFKNNAWLHSRKFAIDEILPSYEKIYADLDAERDK